MAEAHSGAALKYLRTLLRDGASGNLTDTQLLERFLARRDDSEAAFAALVERHGPMVWRLCRAALGDSHDAQDAFQATFLVLVRRAGAIRRADSVGPWLFGVARRVSARARADAARRRAHEERGAEMAARSGDDRPDLGPALHEEIARLPEKLRAAVVLCDLEGLSYEEAADRLRCPLGTIKSRLARARDRLRARLTRRGLAPTAGLLAAGLATRSASAAMPAGLAGSTVRAAMQQLAAGGGATAAAGVVSMRGAAWAEGVARSMALANLSKATVAALTLTFAATGAGVLAYRAAGGGPQGTLPQRTPRSMPARPPAKPSVEEVMRLASRVAMRMEDPAERAEALLDLGRAQARRGDRQAARETLRGAADAAAAIGPDAPYTLPHPVMRVAQAQAEAGDREGAHETFERAIPILGAEDGQHQLQNWPNLVAIQVAAEGRVAARGAIERYRRYLTGGGHGPRDAGQVAARLAYLRAQEAGVDAAVRLIEDPATYGDDRLRRLALMEVVRAMRPGDRDAARRALDLAEQSIDADPDAVARCRDLGEVARAEARMGMLDRALETAASIRPGDVTPDQSDDSKFGQVLAYVDIAREQLKARDTAGARDSARTAIRVAAAIGRQAHRPYPLSEAAQVLIRTGDYEEAIRALRPVAYASTIWALTEIAREQRRAGDEEAARATLRRALTEAEEHRRDYQLHPPEGVGAGERDRYLASLTAGIVRILGRLGDVAAALDAVAQIGDAAARREALSGLARDRAEEGDIESALELAGRLSPGRARERALIGIAAAMPARAGPDRPGGAAGHQP